MAPTNGKQLNKSTYANISKTQTIQQKKKKFNAMAMGKDMSDIKGLKSNSIFKRHELS